MTVPTSSPPRRGRRTPRPGSGDGASPGWLPVLARVALLPPVLCYGVAVVVAGVVAALASGTTPGGEPGLGQALAVAIPLWLVAHLVPLQVTGVPLGVLPLAPALLLATLIATVARGAVCRLGPRAEARGPRHGVLVPVVATAAAAHAAIGVLGAALLTPEAVVDASPGRAGVTCGLLGGVAAFAGAARPCGVRTLPRTLSPWVRHGLRGGLLGAAALLTAGAGLLLAATIAEAGAVHDVVADVAPEAGSGAGLMLLTVAYLPNAVVAATSWLVGPGVAIGAASATPMEITSGLLPPVPLAELLPQSTPPTWAGLAFAVPLAVGSIVGWRLAPTAPDAPTRVRATVTAAVGAAVALGGAATLSGGRLGAGPFDPVAIPAVPIALAVLGWILVPGLVVALLAVPLGTSGPRRAPSPRPAAAVDEAVGDAAEGSSVSSSVSSSGEDAADEETDGGEVPHEGVRPGGEARG